MTLIKMYFVGSLRALTADVSRRISEKVFSLSHNPFHLLTTYNPIQDVSQTAQMHLLYTRFRSVSAPLSPLLGELERRGNVHPEELSSLLTESHAAYFAARKGLLVGRLVEEIKGLDPGRTELVELVSYSRCGCGLVGILRFNVFARRDRAAAISSSCVWTNSICIVCSSIQAKNGYSMWPLPVISTKL